MDNELDAKHEFILVLDTDIASDFLFSNKDSFRSIYIDIICTNAAFHSPVYITIFTYFELIKGCINDSDKTLELLKRIEKYIDGFLQNDSLTFCPSSSLFLSNWIRDGIFLYDDYMVFFGQLYSAVSKHISNTLCDYFLETSYIIIFVQCLLTLPNSFDKFLPLLISFSVGDLVRVIREYINTQISSRIDIELFNKTKSLQRNFFEDINFDIVYWIKSQFDFQDFELDNNGIFKKISVAKESFVRLFKEKKYNGVHVPSLLTNSDFLEIIYAGSINKSEQSFYRDVLKYLVINSPINNRRFDLNDFVDCENVFCMQSELLTKYHVMYCTRDRKWRGFLHKYKSKYPFLEWAFIIGDEGEFDDQF